MKVSGVLILAGLLGLTHGSIAFAKDAASVKILSPAGNERLDAGEEYPLSYEVTPGPGGDHFHVWVDKDRGPGIHDSKGTYALPKLSPGKHGITTKGVNKGATRRRPRPAMHLSTETER